MAVQRRTTVTQKLEINIDLGELPQAKRPPTMRVRRKVDSVEMRINVADFKDDGRFPPSMHLELEASDPYENVDFRADVTERDETSLFADDELATLTIKQLRELPEFTRIPDAVRRTLRKKDSYIAALIKVRNPQADLRAAL